MTTLLLIYAGLSFLIGGGAATVEIWSPPKMRDRADGRGKVPAPKMTLGRVVFFGLFVVLFWPLMAVVAISDTRNA